MILKRLFLYLVLTIAVYHLRAQVPSKSMNIPAADTLKPVIKKPVVADRTKSCRKIEGLFTLYQDTVTGSVQWYIRKDQLGKEFIYQSFSLNGPTSLFLNHGMHRTNLIFHVKKSFDKLEFAMVNTGYYYNPDNAIHQTAGIDIPETIFWSERFSVEDEGGYLLNADGLFISDKLDMVKPLLNPGVPAGAVFNLGGFNSSKSRYNVIRSFPGNTDVIVDMAFDNPMPFNSGGGDITDARYVRVRVQHTFVEVPVNDFKPRFDDPRVGFFTSQVTDQTSMSPTPYRDVIRKWNLVKKDPNAVISEPVEPIVWWVDKATPVEYRKIIIQAGLRWNEAFEKAGFKNAVQMKMMPDDADWGVGDIRYNIIRWVSSVSPPYGAIGFPFFINPRTGQLLGSGIVIEWGAGSGSPVMGSLFSAPGEVTVPPEAQTLNINSQHFCSIGQDMQVQLQAARTFLETTDAPPEELLEIHRQHLYYLVLHEMGHTLGLNHNMKASQMLSPAQMHDKTITQNKGLMSSVMDYPVVNWNPDRSRQGDYYTTKPGPYDLWAIEFGYTPVGNAEEEKRFRDKILSRSTEPDLVFGNDGDDMRMPGGGIDPRINLYDLSNDAMSFADERFRLINSAIAGLKEKFVRKGESYALLRSRYNILITQRIQLINVVNRYIGGVYTDKAFAGQNGGAVQPFTPVPAAIQKKAMDLLTKYVFSPGAFAGDSYLFPYLQFQRRGMGFRGTTEDPKIAAIYRNLFSVAVNNILHPVTMQRMIDSRAYGNQYPLASVIQDLVKNLFDADIKGNVNTNRQYMQIMLTDRLITLGIESGAADLVTRATLLHALKTIKAKLLAAVSANEETKIHRAGLLFKINAALDKK